MIKYLKIIALLFILIPFIGKSQMTTIPVGKKRAAKITRYRISHYYDMVFSDVEGENTNTSVWIRLYKHKYYSNYPYVVKVDSVKKCYKIYKYHRLMLLYFWKNPEPKNNGDTDTRELLE